MSDPVLQFIVVALLAALFMWFLSSVKTLDATVVNFIRIALLVVLTIMLLNVVLTLIFGQGLRHYIP